MSILSALFAAANAILGGLGAAGKISFKNDLIQPVSPVIPVLIASVLCCAGLFVAFRST